MSLNCFVKQEPFFFRRLHTTVTTNGRRALMIFSSTIPTYLATAAVLFWTILALVRPNSRTPLTAAALATAGGVAIRAIAGAALEHHTAMRATAGDVDLTMKERVLAEAYAEGLPRLAFAATVLALTFAFSLFALRSARARLASLASVIILFIPMAWLGTRHVGLHDRTMREYAARYTPKSEGAAPTNDECFWLSDAVRAAGGMTELERQQSGARDLAHACVGRWLDAIDRGGADKAELDEKAHVAHMLVTIEGTSALDLVAESVLLVDDAQRVEVRRRLAVTADDP